MISFREFIVEFQEIKKADLNKLEKYLDKVFANLGIDVEFTRHFIDRVNDERNIKQITFHELKKLFIDVYNQHGKKLIDFFKARKDYEGLLKDISTDVNTPFALNYDYKSNQLELVAKTIMRKKNFVPNNSKDVVLKV